MARAIGSNARTSLPPQLPTPHLDTAGRSRLSVVSATREPITWRDVDWLRSQTKLPILLKGILDPDDARLAIDALPPIAEAVAGRIAVLLDGGIRRGTDIVKSLALGASAVLIGRPYAFAPAVEGADGVARAIAILREELETALALLGHPSVAMIDRSVLW